LQEERKTCRGSLLPAPGAPDFLTPDSAEKPGPAWLALEGSRLRLPEASRTPLGAASSAPPSFSSENGFSAKSTPGSWVL